MLPVLFALGSLSISSFGFFLSLGFVIAVFIIWRLAVSYDLEQEKTLDLILLSFFGGIFGARIYFVLLNWELYGSVDKILLINRYPGLSFWGGLMGGILVLWFFSNKLKMDFWQIADFGAVGLLAALILGDVGCFLGGCAYGVISALPIATSIVGLIGKRFPTPMLEAIILLLFFISLYKKALRFHFTGKIISQLLIVIGLVKFWLEFLRGDTKRLVGWVTYSHVLSILSIILGLVVFYTQSNRSLKKDISWLMLLPSSEGKRAQLAAIIKKNWYNRRINLKVRAGKFKQETILLVRKLSRRLHVKTTQPQP